MRDPNGFSILFRICDRKGHTTDKRGKIQKYVSG